MFGYTKEAFSLGDDTYESQADKIKDQTASLSATFYGRDSDGKYRLIADDDDVNIDAPTIAGWFAAVPSQPTGGIITTMTVVTGMTAIVTSVTGTVIAAVDRKDSRATKNSPPSGLWKRDIPRIFVCRKDYECA